METILPNDASISYVDRSHNEDAVQRTISWMLHAGFKLAAPVRLSSYDDSQNWPYGHHLNHYDVACRGQAIWLSKEEFTLVLSPAPRSLRVKCEIPTVVIYRPWGSATIEWLVSNVDQICQELNLCVIIKSVPTSIIGQLPSRTSLRTYSDNECWHECAKFDDQTYPEVIIESTLGKFIEHRANRLCLEVNRPLATKAEFLNQIFEQWLSWYLKRNRQFDDQLILSYYKNWLATRKINESDVCMTFSLNDELVAFTLGNFVNSEQIDLWVSLSLQRNHRLPAAVLRQSVLECFRLNAKRVNLGGSEGKSLHDFKCKCFGIQHLREMTHLICLPKETLCG